MKQKKVIKSLAAGLAVAVLALSAPAQSGGDVRLSIAGDAADWFCGAATAAVGDINGDGWPDLVIGASGEASAGPYTGVARVISGRDGTVLATFHGSASLDELGYAVCGAGDVNHDGYPDIIVGAIGESHPGAYTGSARVFSGEWIAKTALGQTPLTPQVLHVVFGGAAGDKFGLVVANVGDIDQDGTPDFMVGAPGGALHGAFTGYVRVYSGATGQMLAQFDGDAAGDQFGHSGASAGDINGDGYPDIIVGAFGNDQFGSNSGIARIFSGEWIARTSRGQTPVTPQVLMTLHGAAAGDKFGTAVGTVGDVNLDGHPDLVITSPTNSSFAFHAGIVQVFSGEWIASTLLNETPVTPQVLFSFHGEAADDQLGYTAESAGDVDGDGHPDIFAGAFYNSSLATTAGAAYVWSGADGTLLRAFHGTTSGGQLGHGGGAADFNRDGFSDVIVGAPFENPNGTWSGRAQVLSVCAVEPFGIGSPGNALTSTWIPGAPATAHLGTVHVAGANAGATGLVGISAAPASFPLDNITVLLDLNPSFISFFPFGFNGVGAADFVVDVKNPTLAGSTLYAQVVALDAVGLDASNGLMFLFCP